MTVLDEERPAADAATPAPAPAGAMDAAGSPEPTVLAKVATALGWTQGQLWTVLLGLALAIPASVFGLGPTLDGAEVDPLAAGAPALQDSAGAVSTPTSSTPASGEQPAGSPATSPNGTALPDAGTVDS